MKNLQDLRLVVLRLEAKLRCLSFSHTVNAVQHVFLHLIRVVQKNTFTAALVS